MNPLDIEPAHADGPATGASDKSATASTSDPLAGKLFHELRRASGALASLMTQQFSEVNLKPSEATMLITIGSNPNCTQSDIARTHRVKQANLVPLIAKLERDRLIVRTPGKGRIISLALSAHGEVMLADVTQRFEQIEACLSRQIDGPGVSALVQTLQFICHNACHFDSAKEPY